jgi:hypothetical protein
VTYLPQLKDQLVASPARPSRRPRATLIAAIVAVVLLLAAAALAATGVIEIGSDIEPPARFGNDPGLGPGTAVEGSVRLLPLRVEDPAGGPPWGMRIVTTSRGLRCLQVGRVVDGKLGVLGQDGIAHNDGRFHELSPRFATISNSCASPDARGNTFIAVESMGGLASGEGWRRSCLGPGEGAPGRKRCPVADHRRFLYGLAGPNVTELSYENKGRVRSVRTSGPEGAYLIVLAERQRGGGELVSTAPRIGHPFARITYRDGSVCPPRGVAGKLGDCEREAGYRSLLTGLDRDAVRRPMRAELDGRRLTVSFSAPVAVNDARLSYGTMAHFERSCPQIYFVPMTNRNVRRGSLVELEMKIPRRCHGPIVGTVTLRENPSGLPAPGGNPRTSIMIGRFLQWVP